MSRTLLETYYEGICRQLRAEISFINSLLAHQGEKGRGNEAVLRDLLVRLIPKKYGIGTGFVIDRNGNQSRQCDIVIYDQTSYPSILSLTSVHLFPIDICHATIEVKTTLDGCEANSAIQNIRSVAALDFVTDRFSIPVSGRGGTGTESIVPSPPFGVVFAFESNAKKFETYKSWFEASTEGDRSPVPFLVACLDQGLIETTRDNKLSGLAIALSNDATSAVDVGASLTEFSRNGISYPVKNVGGKPVAIDQSRVLLLFVIKLAERLSKSVLDPSFRFSDHYFKDSTRFAIEV